MAKISVSSGLQVTAQQLQEHFPKLISEIIGDAKAYFSLMSPTEDIAPGSLVYVLKDKLIENIKKSPATLVLAPVKFKDLLKDLPAGQTWLLSPNPELAMAFVKKQFVQPTPYKAVISGVHPHAVVDSSAELGKNVTIASGAVIGARVQLADDVFIGANSIIEADTVIGKGSTIHPLVFIGHSTQIGERCEVKPQATIAGEGYGYAHDEKGNHYRIPHSGRVILHNDVHVGSSTCIDRGSLGDTIIGEGTKIDNQCHLAHNTVTGKNCLITAQFGAAGSCTVGDNFISGGKASLGGHITIANNVQIAGMSGVTGSIEEAGAYGGYPLQPLSDFLKTKAAVLHLTEMRKQLKQLLKNN